MPCRPAPAPVRAQVAAGLGAVNTSATIAALAALRSARTGASLSRAQVAERAGLVAASLTPIEQPGADPRLSSPARYATAIGARLEITVIPPP